jgi:hypothetical protein
MNLSRRSAPLSVEALEDRFLLSVAVIPGAGMVAAPHDPAASQQAGKAQPLSRDDSLTHETMTGPVVPVGPARNPLEQAEYARQGESREVQTASGTNAEVPSPGPIPVTGEQGIGKVLYSAAPPPRATIYLGTREPDRDGDSPMVDKDDYRPPTHPAVVENYLSSNGAFAPPYDSVSSAPRAKSAQAGSPPPALNLLSAAEWQAAGLAGFAVVLPATAPSPERGWEQRMSEGYEGGETLPNVPESQPLVIAPPSAAPNALSPAALPGELFADFLPIDGETIQRRANAFFEQLPRLSEQWKDIRVIEKLTPWFVSASVVIYEWLRLRRMRSLSAVVSEDDCGPGPASLLAGEGG